MDRIVPDASIILRWALGEDKEIKTDKALSLFQNFVEGKCEILLPTLWTYEVGNVLGMKNPKSAEEIMGILLDCEFKEWGMTEEICKLIFGLMNTLQVTFYDASYHALAIQHKAKFITSDKEYFRKTKDKSNIILYE